MSNNSVPVAELPNFIRNVHDAVRELTSGGTPSAATAAPEADKPSTAQIRKSVRPDGLVSFIDGKTYKTLKRHLTSHGLDPRTYRDRYGLAGRLPDGGPRLRREALCLAKAIGLGQPGAMAKRQPNQRKGRHKAA